jgi:hypothetical protein
LSFLQQLSESVLVEDGHAEFDSLVVQRHLVDVDDDTVEFVSNIVAVLTPVGDALKRAVFDPSSRSCPGCSGSEHRRKG